MEILKSLIKRAFTSFAWGEAVHAISFRYFLRKKLPKGHCGVNSYIKTPSWINKGGLNNIYLGNNCHIDNDNVLYCTNAKFIMKDNSETSVGFTVVTGNHQRVKGLLFQQGAADNNYEKDIIVEEDVWIGSNVTLLAGAYIGRGSTIGAGTVLAKKVPPYSIVRGNPAKIVGFVFTPEEVVEHEKALYPEEIRLPIEVLEKNYNKYFLQRIKEIKEFGKL